MPDDIVTRLREQEGNNAVLFVLMDDAADEIERLRADRDRWRKVADLCVIALGIPDNDVDRIAVNAYDRAVRGE